MTGCTARWWPWSPEEMERRKAEGRWTMEPFWMCAPAYGYPVCELHGCGRITKDSETWIGPCRCPRPEENAQEAPRTKV